MTEGELRKFDKETLVRFIFANPFFKEMDLQKNLDYIENKVQIDKAFAKDAALLQEMSEATKRKDWARFDTAFKKSKRLEKVIDKLLAD